MSEEDRLRRRLRSLARDAERLAGAGDAKLVKAVDMVRRLIVDGFSPIVFCRFIPTAEYVAEALRGTLGAGEGGRGAAAGGRGSKGAAVAAVTGALPPDEREDRIDALGAHDGPRVLVATDCLSEGVNLQAHFDAVIHYDLAWNPTRHEQREGRVDRFNQPSPVVRAVTYYGADNRIDGIVLDVLLRKHEQIRRRLGVSVPVPVDSNRVVEAIMEGLLLRRGGAQLQLDLSESMAGEQRELFAEWDDAASRERRSRTRYAQAALRPGDVAPDVKAARHAIGSAASVEGFVREVAGAYGAVASDHPGGGVAFDWRAARPEVREVLAEAGARERFQARFSLPVGDREVHLTRTHPLVERLAAHVLDTALDPRSGTGPHGIARRCGAIRTRAVTVRTTLLLVRFRFNLVAIEGGRERPLLAEDARVLAFTGTPDRAVWLDQAGAEALLDARPDENVAPEQAMAFVRRITDGWDALAPCLAERAGALAGELVEAHRRVRDAARRKGVRFIARPHLPPDVVGVYVLLPASARLS